MTKEQLKDYIKRDLKELEHQIKGALDPTLPEELYICALTQVMRLTQEIRDYKKELYKFDDDSIEIRLNDD